MKEEALKLADELQALNDAYENKGNERSEETDKVIDLIRKLVAELDKQGEPVAWWNGKSKFCSLMDKSWDAKTGGILSFDCDIPLYTTPQTKELDKQGEPVACYTGVNTIGFLSPNCKLKVGEFLYTTPHHASDVKQTKDFKYDPETGEPLIDGYPLYSGLPTPQTKPLSDEEIFKLWGDDKFSDSLLEFARAIEERHGIK